MIPRLIAFILILVASSVALTGIEALIGLEMPYTIFTHLLLGFGLGMWLMPWVTDARD